MFAARVMCFWLALVFSLGAGTQVSPGSVVSWCTGDAYGDGRNVLLLITGDSQPGETGARYGNRLLVCEKPAEPVDFSVPLRLIILKTFEYPTTKPTNVQLGDIDGDGHPEVLIQFYKPATRDPQPALRPHFYKLTKDGLSPVWRGSRLSRPYTECVLCDIDGDGRDNLVAIETLGDGRKLLCAYVWDEFGFVAVAQSGPFAFMESLTAIEESGEDGCRKLIRVTVDSGTKEEVTFAYTLGPDGDGRLNARQIK